MELKLEGNVGSQVIFFLRWKIMYLFSDAMADNTIKMGQLPN